MTAETIADRFGGWKGVDGDWYQAFIKPITDAATEELIRMSKVHADMKEIFSKHFAKKELSQFRKANYYIESLGFSLTKEQMLATLLNWGNKSNRERLLSRDWTEAHVKEIFNRLTDRDFEFAQDVWDYIGSYYDELAALNQRTTGTILKRIEADPFTWNGKEYRGGYFPAKEDTSASINGKINEENLNHGRNQEFSGRASARSGATKERTPLRHVTRGRYSLVSGSLSSTTQKIK